VTTPVSRTGHHVEVFRDDKTGRWGWQCLTLGCEHMLIGRLDMRRAEEEAEKHRVLTRTAGGGVTPTIRATEFEVSLLPEEIGPEAASWSITVEYRGKDMWAVCGGRQCADAGGVFAFEPRPSERDDDWLTRYRFPMERALEIAMRAVGEVRIYGKTAREVYQEWREKQLLRRLDETPPSAGIAEDDEELPA
jgi:hypothetical protein